MSSSIFDIFKIGIGPSSSHTMGPMRAAARFAAALAEESESVHQLFVELFGSLALTGQGHCIDRAILLGLEGRLPDEIDPDAIASILERIRSEGRVRLGGGKAVEFIESRDLVFRGDRLLPGHGNGMRFTANDARGGAVLQREYLLHRWRLHPGGRR